MTANKRLTKLLSKYPMIASDYDADGKPTKEALRRATDWLWEQATAAEQQELIEQQRTKLADEVYDDLVRDGVIEEFIGPDGEGRIRFLDDPR